MEPEKTLLRPWRKTALSAAAAVISLWFFCDGALAAGTSAPDDHAPIGVMGEHNHKAGELMLAYRYGFMKMDGIRDGTDDLDASQVLADFMTTPLDMSVQMHMFGFMCGITDRLTLMGMGTYVRKSMTSTTRTDRRFKAETEGLGDTELLGLFTLYDSLKAGHGRRSGSKVHVNFGLSFPTGSTGERGDTPAGPNLKLPYPMQLGSGTYDPLLAVTWVMKRSAWSAGLQSSCALRFGKNPEDYRLGNEFAATAWAARNINGYASLSLRLAGNVRGNINGADGELNPKTAPTAWADLASRKSVKAFAGLNLSSTKGALSGNRLAVEFGLPLYQNLDGPQLKSDYSLIVGWQFAL